MVSKIDEQLNKILSGDISDLVDNHNEDESNVEDVPVATELVPVTFEGKSSEIALDNKDIQEDYEFARSNLYGLIGRSNAALELALKISAMSEHPRALEVAATLIKMSSEVSKDLIEIHKAIEKKNSRGKDAGEHPPGKYTQINNYYQKDEKDVSSMLDDLDDE